MTKKDVGYVTVVGAALIEPMLDLVEELESMPKRAPNEVQTAQGENGYSLSIILLAVILFESALNRTAFVRQEEKDNRKPPDYFKKISPDQNAAAEIEEVFAVRNVIAHNHLWEATTRWTQKHGLKFGKPAKLREGYGDKRHVRVIDPQSRKSRILGINMFPPRIWRRDAYIVLKTIAKGLDVIESMDRRYFYLSPNHFRFQKKTVTFNGVAAGLILPQDA
jgi:hypothetical protein